MEDETKDGNDPRSDMNVALRDRMLGGPVTPMLPNTDRRTNCMSVLPSREAAETSPKNDSIHWKFK